MIPIEIHNEHLGFIFQIVSVQATGSLVQLLWLNVFKYWCLRTDVYLFVVSFIWKEAPVVHVGLSTNHDRTVSLIRNHKTVSAEGGGKISE